MRLSALEQVPLFDGSTPLQALEDMVSLARGLEELDFHRFWIAEHHNTPVFMSSAPELVMTHLLDQTSRIRIGSGGVMAMHQGSLRWQKSSSLWQPCSPDASTWDWDVPPAVT